MMQRRRAETAPMKWGENFEEKVNVCEHKSGALIISLTHHPATIILHVLLRIQLLKVFRELLHLIWNFVGVHWHADDAVLVVVHVCCGGNGAAGEI